MATPERIAIRNAEAQQAQADRLADLERQVSEIKALLVAQNAKLDAVLGKKERTA